MLNVKTIVETEKGLLVNVTIRPKDSMLTFTINKLWVGFESKKGQPYAMMPSLPDYKEKEQGQACFLSDSMGNIDIEAHNQLAKAVLAEHERMKEYSAKKQESLF